MAAAVVEALDAAKAAGDEPWLREHIAAELAEADGSTVERIIDGTRRHAVRRTAEMEAAADMLTELGVPPLMANASRALHQRLTPREAWRIEALRERPERLGQRLEGIRLRVVREVHDHEVDSGVAVSGGRRHSWFGVPVPARCAR